MQNYRDTVEMRQNRLLLSIKKELPNYVGYFFDYCKSTKNYSPNTTIEYARELRMFYKFLLQANPTLTSMKDITLDYLDNLTALDLQEFISQMSAYVYKNGEFVDDNTITGAKLVRNGANGKARKVSALKSFYKYLYGMGMLKSNPASILSSPRIPKKEIVRLERQESNELLKEIANAVDADTKYKFYERDLTIITLLLGTGIRVSECVNLNMADIIWNKKALRIIRKGGNEQIVYYNDKIEHLLLSYIDSIERTEPLLKLDINPSANETALFVSHRGTRLSTRSIERIVKKHTQEAGIMDKRITPHKLRSTFGTNTYQQTGDVYLTADLLGHSGLEVVKRYAQIDEDRKLKARDNVDWT